MNRLRAGFSLMEIMIVVSIISMLAAIALPSFISYIRASKTSEALSSMRKIYDGETSYFIDGKSTRAGVAIATQFVACPPTPATIPSANKSLGNWDQEEWIAIQFAQESPVNFSYSVDAAGTDITSSFTARAEGNLDGDAVTSLFERIGFINASTGEIESVGGIYVDRELE